MGEGLFAGVALVGLGAHEVGDEVFGGVGDVVPVGGVELVVAADDLGEEVRVALVIEGLQFKSH